MSRSNRRGPLGPMAVIVVAAITLVVIAACGLGSFALVLVLESGVGSAPPAGPDDLTQPTTSRAAPIPYGEIVENYGWAMGITEVVRGGGALEILLAASSANQDDRPPDGYEYIMVRVYMRDLIPDLSSDRSPNPYDFRLTGDDHVAYDPVSGLLGYDRLAVENLEDGGVAEGYIIFLVPESTGNWLLVHEDIGLADDAPIWFAAEPDARVEPIFRVADRPPASGRGSQPSEPAALGETVVTDRWEITLDTVIDGRAAFDFLQSVNDRNAEYPPLEGNQYLVLQISARYLGDENEPGDHTRELTQYDFGVTFTDGTAFGDSFASASAPRPVLDVHLYPGGQYRGYIVKQAPVDTPIVIVFRPPGEYSSDNYRYFSLRE